MSGVSRLRRSKSAPREMPRAFHAVEDTSRLRGTHYKETKSPDVTGGNAPLAYRPFASSVKQFPETPQPTSAERNIDGEGPIRGRQADKSSRLMKG